VGIGITNPKSLLTLANADTSADLRIGNLNFNRPFSGRLAFDKNVTDNIGTCGFEFLHNGVSNTLFLLSGGNNSGTEDTLMSFGRNSKNVNIFNRLKIGSNQAAASQLDVDGRI